MRFKKILIVPLLFFVYIWLINGMANPNISSTVSPSGEGGASGAAVSAGIGTTVTVQVTRATSPYLFGLVNLPNYIDGIGFVKTLHTMFFYFLGILTIIFIIIEWRNKKWQKRK